MVMHSKILQLRREVGGGFLSSNYDEPLDFRVKVEGRRVKGYLAVFGVKDGYGSVAIKGCFENSIRQRGPESGAKSKIIFLAFHNPFEPIGQFRKLQEDDYGLYFEADIDDTPGTPQRCLDQINSGTINQYSYGFRYIWDKMKWEESFMVNGKKEGAVLMYECNLFEGSCLAINAANPETYTVRSRKDLQQKLIELNAEAEEIVSFLPQNKQIQVRQLITRYKTLASYKPLKKALKEHEPQETAVSVGGYILDTKQFL